jgi:hypothetical protein
MADGRTAGGRGWMSGRPARCSRVGGGAEGSAVARQWAEGSGAVMELGRAERRRSSSSSRSARREPVSAAAGGGGGRRRGGCSQGDALCSGVRASMGVRARGWRRCGCGGADGTARLWRCAAQRRRGRVVLAASPSSWTRRECCGGRVRLAQCAVIGAAAAGRIKAGGRRTLQQRRTGGTSSAAVPTCPSQPPCALPPRWRRRAARAGALRQRSVWTRSGGGGGSGGGAQAAAQCSVRSAAWLSLPAAHCLRCWLGLALALQRDGDYAEAASACARPVSHLHAAAAGESVCSTARHARRDSSTGCRCALHLTNAMRRPCAECDRRVRQLSRQSKAKEGKGKRFNVQRTPKVKSQFLHRHNTRS